MKAGFVDALSRLPAAAVPDYPEGAPFVRALAHGRGGKKVSCCGQGSVLSVREAVPGSGGKPTSTR